MHFDERKPIDLVLRESELQRAREIYDSADRFAEYIHTFRPKLMPMITHVMRYHPNEVEDAFQESCIRIYNGLPSFNGNSTLDTWSYRVGFRTTLGVLKHFGQTVKNSNTVSLEEQAREGKDGKIPFEIPSSGLDPLDKALIRERLGHIGKAIQDLPQDFRSVFVLGEIHGLSTDEMAEAVGANPSTVRSRLNRARTHVTLFVEREEKRRRPVLATNGAQKDDALAKNGVSGIAAENSHGPNEPTRARLPVWQELMRYSFSMSPRR